MRVAKQVVKLFWIQEDGLFQALKELLGNY